MKKFDISKEKIILLMSRFSFEKINIDNRKKIKNEYYFKVFCKKITKNRFFE